MYGARWTADQARSAVRTAAAETQESDAAFEVSWECKLRGRGFGVAGRRIMMFVATLYAAFTGACKLFNEAIVCVKC